MKLFKNKPKPQATSDIKTYADSSIPYLRQQKKISEFLSWSEHLRFDPKPDWIAKNGDETYALSLHPPKQKFWEAENIEILGITSNVYKAYRLIKDDRTVKQQTPIVPLEVANLASQNHDEITQFFAVLNKKICVLANGEELANSLLDNFWHILWKHQTIGAVRRTKLASTLSDEDMRSITNLLLYHSEGFGCVLDGIPTDNIWEDVKLATRIARSENVGAAVSSLRRLQPSEYYNHVTYHYQECELEDLFPKYSQHFIAYSPTSNVDVRDIYHLALSGRPRISAIGVSEAPFMPIKMLEVLYLIYILKKEDIPTSSKNLAEYVFPGERDSNTTNRISQLLRSAAEKLGHDMAGNPRLYEDSNGQWQHAIPMKAEDTGSMDVENWKWYPIFQDRFDEIRRQNVEADSGGVI